MKISILISAIIVGLTALFGFQQKEKIKHLTTEWEDLKTIALEKNIPTDPKATFSSQRIRSDSARAAREKAISDFASELAAFVQRMEEAGEANTPEIQKEVAVFLDKLTNMSPSDLKSLIKIVSEDSSIKDETKQQLVMMSIMMISSENPEAALAIISESDKSLDLGAQSRHMLPMLISQFAAKDPVAAAAWVTENGEQLGDELEHTKTTLIQTAARKDFNTALSLVSSLEMSEESNVYGALATGVTAESKNDFLKSLQNEDLTKEQRKSALAAFANSPFIREDFEAASTWLDGPEVSADEKESFISGLNYHGVKESASQWLSWMSQQEAGNAAAERATQNILQYWTTENFVAAGEWIQNQEDGPTKNTAVKTYAETLAPHEPAAAADWADTLPPSDERTQLLQTIHNSLKEQDPSAAAALAEEHQLSVN